MNYKLSAEKYNAMAAGGIVYPHMGEAFNSVRVAMSQDMGVRSVIL